MCQKIQGLDDCFVAVARLRGVCDEEPIDRKSELRQQLRSMAQGEKGKFSDDLSRFESPKVQGELHMMAECTSTEAIKHAFRHGGSGSMRLLSAATWSANSTASVDVAVKAVRQVSGIASLRRRQALPWPQSWRWMASVVQARAKGSSSNRRKPST
jgi:hypothetical protein